MEKTAFGRSFCDDVEICREPAISGPSRQVLISRDSDQSVDRAFKLDLSGLEGLEEMADSRGSREGGKSGNY